MRQLALLFRVSKSAADRIIDRIGRPPALPPRRRFARGTVLIVDGTLVPTRDHAVAAQSKNYRYSSNQQTKESATGSVPGPAPPTAAPSPPLASLVEWDQFDG